MEKSDNKGIRYKDISYFAVVALISILFRSVFSVEIGFFTDVSIAVAIAFIAKYTVRRPFNSAVIFFASCFAILIANDIRPDIFADAYSKGYVIVTNIYKYLRGNAQLESISTLPLLIITVLIFSMVSSWVIHVKGRPKLLLLIYVPTYIFYWYLYYDESYILLAFFLATFGILYLLFANEEKDKFSTDSKWAKMSKNTAFAYCTIAVIVSLLLPKTGSVINSKSADDILKTYLPFVENMREDFVHSRAFANGDAFDFSITSYVSEDGRIGGPVTPSDKLLMTVESKQPYYIRGNVKSTFENDRWSSDPFLYIHRGLEESMDRLTNVKGMEMITITFENISSYTIFAPYRPFFLKSDTNTDYYASEDYEMYFPLSTYKGEKYTVYFDVKDETKSNLEEITPEQRSKYTKLPKNISASFMELTESITEGTKNDLEIIKAVKDYLNENYKYSLEVEAVPDGESVIDHFLFEEKVGYCTYFATATTLMLRAENIPARYIEGFYMQDVNEEGLFEIRGDDGHAWVEAYVSGKGWLTVDTTPGYEINYVPKEVKTVSQEDELIFEGNTDLVLINEANDETESADLSNNQKDSDKSVSMAQAIKNSLVEKPLKAVMLILTMILIIVALRVVYHFIKRRKIWKDISKLSKSEVYINRYHELLTAMSNIGYDIRSGETHMEYALRMKSFVDYMGVDIIKLTDTYYTALYSNHDISEIPFTNLGKLYDFLMEDIKIRMGYKKYISERYIKGRFDLTKVYEKS